MDSLHYSYILKSVITHSIALTIGYYLGKKKNVIKIN